MAFTLKERLEKLRAAELDLRQQQQLVQTILDATPDLVSLKDVDFRYRATTRHFVPLWEGMSRTSSAKR
jgi:PAS domain-containing protein